MVKFSTSPVERARQLRKTMTPQEVRLWLRLRALRPQGLYFRRQVPLMGYILDFACFKSRLIVECDGSQHGVPENLAYDQKRDQTFADAGFLTLRFWNHEINEDINAVADTILARAGEHPTPRTPR